MPIRTKSNQRYHAAMMPPILSSEQRELIYGALQRSGDTMSGDLAIVHAAGPLLKLQKTGESEFYLKSDPAICQLLTNAVEFGFEGGVDICSNTGANGNGNYQPDINFTAAGDLILTALAGKVIRLNAAQTQIYNLIRPMGTGVDLGDGTNKWQDLYLSRNIIVGGTVDGVDVSAIPTTYLPLAGGIMTGDLIVPGNIGHVFKLYGEGADRLTLGRESLGTYIRSPFQTLLIDGKSWSINRGGNFATAGTVDGVDVGSHSHGSISGEGVPVKRIQTGSGTPSGLSEGYIYFDKDNGKLWIHDGTTQKSVQLT